MKTYIIFAVLALVWLMVVVNRNSKRRASRSARGLNRAMGGKESWGKEDCSCGTPRSKWKPLAMNRPDNTVLLFCPQCRNLWEESMSMYGNKWRPVDESYAKDNYTYGRG